MKKYVIKKVYSFDAAHIVPTQKLPVYYEEKCKNIHGHTFKVIAQVRGGLDRYTRMVIDYTLLKPFKNVIDTYLDHSFLIPKSHKKFALKLSSLCSEYDIGVNIAISDYKSRILNKTLFKKYRGGITVVNWDSITAESLSRLLTYVLAEELLNTIRNENYKYVNFPIEVRAAVKETENTMAVVCDWFVIDDTF